MGQKAARLYVSLRRDFLERGDAEALERARALLAEPWKFVHWRYRAIVWLP